MRLLIGVTVALLLVPTSCTATPSNPPAAGAPDVPRTPSSDTSSPDTSGPVASPSPHQSRSGARVIVDASEYGAMLFSAGGQAIYLFDLEDTSRPRCYDACASEWPPVLTEGAPVAGHGVRAGLLGIVERPDGSTQVTYAGHPLYFYAHEEPHEVLCHDFADFGGTWYVVQPSGEPALPV